MTDITVAGKLYQPEVVIQRARRACGWFAFIAALSAANSLFSLAGNQWNFFAGLGATQIIDAMLAIARERAEPSIASVVMAVGLLVNLFVVGAFVAIWQFAKRGSATAYAIGMVLYFLDALIFLAVRYWAGAAFHGFVLIALWGGYAFLRQRRQAEQALTQPQANVEPQVSPVY